MVEDGGAPAEDERPTSRAADVVVPRPLLSTRRLAGVTVALALVPVVRMLWMIRDAPRLQYADYWPMLPTVLRRDGGLDLAGAFEFRNEHPVVFAKLLYWTNTHLASGSNVALGRVVVVIVVLQVVLLALLALRTGPPGRRPWAVLAVAASVLLFARQGLWHFYLSMSGAAWLTANLFAIAALVAQQRRRTGLMLAAAVAASISYGTGLAVWPALLVAGLLRDRSLLRQWYIALLGVLSVVWYRSEFVEINRDTVGRPPVDKAVRQILEVLGAFFYPQDRDISVPIGAAIVLAAGGAAITFAWMRLRDGRDDLAGSAWSGLLVYGFGGAVLAGAARDNVFVTLTASRYAAIGAMVLLSTLGLVASVAPRLSVTRRVPGWVGAALVAPLLVATLLAGSARQPEMAIGHANQDLLVMALQLDVADEATLWLGGLGRMPVGLADLLEANDHIPFDGSFDLDCGRLGTALDPSEVAPLPIGTAARVELAASERLVPGYGMVGWVDTGGRTIDCIVIVEDGRITGAAGFGPPANGYARGLEGARPDGTWFHGLAEPADSATAHVRFEGDDLFHPIPISPTAVPEVTPEPSAP